MSRSLQVRDTARSDMAVGRRWLEEQEAGLGMDFLNDVESTLERIEGNPELYGRIWRSFRAALLSRFQYQVIYFFTDTEIIVVAVQHSRQSRRRWQSRL